MDLRDAYRVLDVSAGATEEAVRDARKLLAKVWHPDRHANDPELQKKAELKLAEVNAAFEAIRNAKFPATVPGPVAASPRPASPPPPAPPPPSPAPERPPPDARPHLEFTPRRRVRWSVLLLVFAAIGIGTYFAIVKLGTTSQSVASTPHDAGLVEPPDAAIAGPMPAADAGVVVIADATTTPDPDQPAGTFGLGSTRDQVRAAQGPPTKIFTVITEDWSYGFSQVSFETRTGRVVGWWQIDTRLNAKLVPRDAAIAAKAKAAGSFTKGSTKDEVIAVQGTPAKIDHVIDETWTYGQASSIDFDAAGKVLDWTEHDVKLKAR
jgi:hypothetical protein